MSTTEIAEPEIENAGAVAEGENGAASARRFQFSTASSLSSARQESLESWHRNFLKLASASLGDLLRVNL